MATYVNVLYLPVPVALTKPTPAEVSSILRKPYSEGFDRAYALLRKEEVELTLAEIVATFASQLQSVSAQLGVPPEQLKLGQVRALALNSA